MSTYATEPVDTPSIERTRWRIDPARSRVEFRTPTLWGRATVKGRFERYDGTLDLRETPAVDLTVEATSLDTHNRLRDKHLRSADFFDAANHLYVRFVSDSATLQGDRLTVRGRLFAAGKSMPLCLDATVRHVGDELEVDATADADHRRLGMTKSTLRMIKTPTRLSVHARLVQDATAHGAAFGEER